MVTTRSQQGPNTTKIDYRDAMSDRDFRKMLNNFNKEKSRGGRTTGRKRRRESNESKEREDEPPMKRRFTRSSLRSQPTEHFDDDKHEEAQHHTEPRRRSARLARRTGYDGDDDVEDVEGDAEENLDEQPIGTPHRRRSARLAKNRATDVAEENGNDSSYDFSDQPETTPEQTDEDEDESFDEDDGARRTSRRLQALPRVRYFGDGEHVRKEGVDPEPQRPVRNRRRVRRFEDQPARRRGGRGPAAQPRRRRRRSVAKYNESDSDSDEGESRQSASDSDVSTDTYMQRRAERRMRRDRAKINPINLHDLGIYDDNMAPSQKTTNADVSPMEIDLNVDWKSVGGLEGHISKLKEMVVLPLLYREEFDKFNMTAPKGVLFHGPPGTGKTLVARVLAAQCSRHGRKVSFYMRKGADCLSKWVGEAERQLRLLFDEAHKNQPAIIFFDEIDGLAPVRSSRQDQIHSSIVSTLLALMDGLDSRGQIIVIGATNRPDAIDPALRRPGRFDRELCFQLPGREARRNILKIHSKDWDPPIDDEMLQYLSDETVGYCGADLEALCREAFLAAIRRTFPQIYQSNVKLQIDPDSLRVEQTDFDRALHDITPSSQRSSIVYARALPSLLQPLLQPIVDEIRGLVSSQFRLHKDERVNGAEIKMDDPPSRKRHHGRLLISGPSGHCGQSHIGAATLHLLEEFPLYSLDLPNLFGDPTTKNAEEVCLRVFREAQRNVPSVIYWPHVDRWWSCAYESLRTSILLLIEDIPKEMGIFLLASSDCLVDDLDDVLKKLFVGNEFALNERCGEEHIHKFWEQLMDISTTKPQKRQIVGKYPELPPAESPPQEDSISNEKMEEQSRRDVIAMRVFIRSVCNRLIKQFKDFINPMDVEEVVCNDLSLLDVREKNNDRQYPTMEAFLNDVDTIVRNVKGSANIESLKARQILNEACHLQDMALSMACQVDRELSKRCDEMARKNGRVGAAAGRDDANGNVSENSTSALDREQRYQRRAMGGMEPESNVEAMDVDDGAESKVDELAEDMMELDIDVDRLGEVVAMLAEKSVEMTVDEAEDLFYHILRTVYRYSSSWDRTLLVKELIRVTNEL